MRICWDNLEKLVYDQKEGVWLSQGKNRESIWAYDDLSGWPYLRKVGSRSLGHKRELEQITQAKKEYSKGVKFPSWYKPAYLSKAGNKPSGYLYVVREEYGLYKIGSTKNIDKRVSTFRTIIPQKVELVYDFYVVGVCVLEKAVHDMFADKRIKGEWFDLSNEDLDKLVEFVGLYVMDR